MDEFVPPGRMLGFVSQKRGGKPEGALTQEKRSVTGVDANVIQGWDRQGLEITFGPLDRMLKCRNSAAWC